MWLNFHFYQVSLCLNTDKSLAFIFFINKRHHCCTFLKTCDHVYDVSFCQFPHYNQQYALHQFRILSANPIWSMLEPKWGFNFLPCSPPLIHLRRISQFRPPLQALSVSARFWWWSAILEHCTRAARRRRNGPREHSTKWDTLAQWLSCQPIAIITCANGLLAISSWCVRCGKEMRQSGEKSGFLECCT